MACTLAKIDQPHVDPRKPYTAIKTGDAFSGRSYDEKYITRFILNNRLPLNSTTAFLTPAFRNLDKTLTVDLNLVGRPAQVYKATLELLDYTYQGKVSAEDLLSEIVRILLTIRKENQERINTLLTGLGSEDALPLSSEEIVSLIDQHLKCKNSSRLPVLIVAAAYNAMEEIIGERILPLQSHNAADEQTGSLGDIEICLENDDHIVTVYEMKMRRVTIDDINRALEKIKSAHYKMHNYIFTLIASSCSYR
jgi:DNA adenine methylase